MLTTAEPITTSQGTAQPAPAAAPAAAAPPVATTPPQQTPPVVPADQPKTEEKPAAPYELTAPDGSVAPEVLKAFTNTVNELRLPKESAQKVLDSVAPVMQAQVEKVQAEWVQKATTDKEFGGDALQANLAIAKKALTAFGSPELIAFLRESGLGNHPELIRAFYRAGKQVSEDRFVEGKSPAGAGKDFNDPEVAAARLYPNHK